MRSTVPNSSRKASRSWKKSGSRKCSRQKSSSCPEQNAACPQRMRLGTGFWRGQKAPALFLRKVAWRNKTGNNLNLRSDPKNKTTNARKSIRPPPRTSHCAGAQGAHRVVLQRRPSHQHAVRRLGPPMAAGPPSAKRRRRGRAWSAKGPERLQRPKGLALPVLEPMRLPRPHAPVS